MFELLRKFSLLMLLFVAAMGTYLAMENSTDWREPLWVSVYPINGDGREHTADHIASLDEDQFNDIEDFMRLQADRYDIVMDEPVRFKLGRPIDELPPALGERPGPLDIAAWSLRLRWWANRITADQPGPEPDIRLFLVYYDPEMTPVVGHSVGLQRGLVGIVNVFASQVMAETNNFVIAHEMLHTLGATDKYDYAGNMPAFPDGYADPQRMPLYPQTAAEIMGGRIPVDANRALIPDSLHQVVVGPATAEEIRWLR